MRRCCHIMFPPAMALALAATVALAAAAAGQTLDPPHFAGEAATPPPAEQAQNAPEGVVPADAPAGANRGADIATMRAQPSAEGRVGRIISRWFCHLPLICIFDYALTDVPAEAAQTDQAANRPQARQQALKQRVDELIDQPRGKAQPAEVQQRLEELAYNANQLAQAADDPAEQLDASNVEAQSLYARLQKFPAAPDVDRTLFRLRGAARRAKGLGTDHAEAVGDFWLMTSNLYEINRLGLEPAERRQQAAEAMRGFVKAHPDSPMAEQVTAALAHVLDAETDVPVGALHEAVAGVLPEGWSITRVSVGEVAPLHWPEGKGAMVHAERGANDWKLNPGEASLWVMEAGYDAAEPAEPSYEGAMAGPARELDARWRGYRTFIFGAGGKDWPTWHDDIAKALVTPEPAAAKQATVEAPQDADAKAQAGGDVDATQLPAEAEPAPPAEDAAGEATEEATDEAEGDAGVPSTDP